MVPNKLVGDEFHKEKTFNELTESLRLLVLLSKHWLRNAPRVEAVWGYDGLLAVS